MRSAVMGAVLALGACGAPVDENALPPLVATELEAVTRMCIDAQGKPQTTEAVKRADLNGDGHMDYVLDVDAVHCEGADSVYGDRSKEVEIYAGDGEGEATLAFSDFVYGVTMEGQAPRTKLWVTVTADQCGKPSAPDFASESFCNRALVWNGQTRQFDFAPVSTVRMIE